MKFKREAHLNVPGPKADTRRKVRFWLKETPFWRKVCPEKGRDVDGILERCVSEGGERKGWENRGVVRRRSFGGW
ncbi:hypothetical protein B0T14DRAFT_529316 [Immersiella caudata]|uniref:Uncharacterized protein n=1 Tax=Immersiella caudata TaxID=314043 RepID=A0AA39U4K2_9PEZI|nr:hypothetical protein B0T14DRAFT_529316 [Immersiella caudata]